MRVWDVLGKRRPDDEFEVVGAVKAPDVGLALILAKETHFRHKEGVEYAVRLRGDDVIHPGPYGGDLLGGVTDHSYRRQDAYAGVGGKLRRISADFAAKNLRIEAARPRTARGRRAGEADPDLDPHGTR